VFLTLPSSDVSSHQFWIQTKMIAACRRLLKEVASLSVAHPSLYELARKTVTAHVHVMEPTSPGTFSGRQISFTEIDSAKIRNEIGSNVESLQSWRDSAAAIQGYLLRHYRTMENLWPHDIPTHYLWPLICSYIRVAGGFAYDAGNAGKVIKKLQRHLTSKVVPIIGLVVLEGFSAAKPFQLEKGVTVRPIHDTDLQQLGRQDQPLHSGTGHSSPRTDWWICEIAVQNTRSTTDGWDSIHALADLIPMVLRTFKAGALRVGLRSIAPKDEFGWFLSSHNHDLKHISPGPATYHINHHEMAKIVSHWKGIKKLLQSKSHYLQIPLRRFMSAGSRQVHEDSLVDYVIGLEALLTTDEEQGELSFR
jgi:hypothetical protein